MVPTVGAVVTVGATFGAEVAGGAEVGRLVGFGPQAVSSTHRPEVAMTPLIMIISIGRSQHLIVSQWSPEKTPYGDELRTS
jgi:hypothetical protein